MINKISRDDCGHSGYCKGKFDPYLDHGILQPNKSHFRSTVNVFGAVYNRSVTVIWSVWCFVVPKCGERGVHCVCHFVVACWQGQRNIREQKIGWCSGNKVRLVSDPYYLKRKHRAGFGVPTEHCTEMSEVQSIWGGIISTDRTKIFGAHKTNIAGYDL